MFDAFAERKGWNDRENIPKGFWPSVFFVIFGVLDLYYLYRKVLLCRELSCIAEK